MRGVITELETMGLLETWIESKGEEGRVKQVQTTFDPEWVHEALRYVAASDVLSANEDNGTVRWLPGRAVSEWMDTNHIRQRTGRERRICRV